MRTESKQSRRQLLELNDVSDFPKYWTLQMAHLIKK